MNQFSFKQVRKNEASLLDSNDSNISRGLFGRFSVSFGEHGREYLGVFSKTGTQQDDGEKVLAELIEYFRNGEECPAFASREKMHRFIENAVKKGEIRQNGALNELCLCAEDEKYQFYIRFSPGRKVDAELFCYNKQLLLQHV